MSLLSSLSLAPRIGVSWIGAGEIASHPIAAAVREADGEPVPLPPGVDSWAAEVATLSGLVLTGGNAVDPRRYGQENQGLCRVVIPRRDELEAEVLRFCLSRGLPVLGVCRGMQFLNVELGGSMLQDLTITTVEHEADGEISRFHPVDVLPGTRLATIAGFHGSVRVNSRHHQGLNAQHVAPGLRLSAISPDGVVEGVEGSGEPFVIGVQFHPEIPGEVPEMAAIFQALVARARAHS